MEDSLFAGALSSILIEKYGYATDCDAAKMSIDQWNMAKEDLFGYIDRSAHRNRLRSLINDRLLKYTFTLNSSKVVPVLKRYKIVPADD